MQIAFRVLSSQRVIGGPEASLDRAAAATAPTPISTELLQFIAGGKGATPPAPSKPTAPNNGW